MTNKRSEQNTEERLSSLTRAGLAVVRSRSFVKQRLAGRRRGKSGFRAQSGNNGRKDDSLEADANLAAGRLWQVSQSDETKRHLHCDLEDSVTAFEQNGRDNNREA